MARSTSRIAAPRGREDPAPDHQVPASTRTTRPERTTRSAATRASPRGAAAPVGAGGDGEQQTGRRRARASARPPPSRTSREPSCAGGRDSPRSPSTDPGNDSRPAIRTSRGVTSTTVLRVGRPLAEPSLQPRRSAGRSRQQPLGVVRAPEGLPVQAQCPASTAPPPAVGHDGRGDLAQVVVEPPLVGRAAEDHVGLDRLDRREVERRHRGAPPRRRGRRAQIRRQRARRAPPRAPAAAQRERVVERVVGERHRPLGLAGHLRLARARAAP